MYNIYKFNSKNIENDSSLRNLKILRLDLTEQELYNYRYLDSTKPFTNNTKREPNSPLKKIGFMSSDFSINRPSGKLSLSFFQCLSKYFNQFDIYFYTLNKDNICKNFKNLAFIRKAHNLDHLKEKIINDQIDILIDMQGHMVNNYNEVLLQKVAPIQIHFLGYPGTTGLNTMDYLIADKIVIPETSTHFYREKIAYMPNCYQCNSDYNNITYSDMNAPEITDIRNKLNIPIDKFVFCNFNFDYKMDRKTWVVYLTLLKRIPNSVLLYKTENEEFNQLLLNDAKAHNVDLTQLINHGLKEYNEHLERLSVCNLGLDTYRLNGHTTSSDLIKAGVPYITYTSATYQNRVSKSILIALELEELVCHSFEEYINLAVKLATDKIYYTAIKEKLLKNRNKTLFNVNLYTNDFVNLLFNIWKNHYQPDLKTIWKCYINMDSPGFDILKNETHIKVLHSFVINNNNNINNQECVAYNRFGNLKYKVSEKKEWINYNNCDLWVKEELKEDCITPFSNNYRDTKTHEWKFYPYVHFDEMSEKDIICKVEERGQLLRDLAENIKDCIAFTTNGILKRNYTKQFITFSDDKKDGIWIKEPIEYLYTNDAIKAEINKDYDLPLICIIYFMNTGNIGFQYILKYNKENLYLNTELLLISDVDDDHRFKIINNDFNLRLIETKEKNIDILFNTYSSGDYFIHVSNALKLDAIVTLHDSIIKNNSIVKEKNLTTYL